MIIETLVLGGILYVGYKALKDGDRNEGLTTLDAPKTRTVVEQRIDRTVKTTFDQASCEAAADHREIIKSETRSRRAGFWSLALATGGLFYRPLGILSIPFFLYSTRPFLKHAFELLKKGKVENDTLVSLILLGAMLLGQFFIASVALVLFNWAVSMTARLAERSRHELLDVFGKHPDSVWILVDGIEVSVPFHDLEKGNIVVVQAGEMIPADGAVTEGMATVDQHILTGEARPVERGSGEQVFGSTMVLSGKIHVEVEKTGEESTVSKITEILNSTVDFESSTQLRATLLSERLVKPILIAGGGALPRATE